jgi:chromate transporter
LDAELVAKGLLTRTELIDAGWVFRQYVFSLCHFVGYQINGISGAFISTRYSYPHLCLPIES